MARYYIASPSPYCYILSCCLGRPLRPRPKMPTSLTRPLTLFSTSPSTPPHPLPLLTLFPSSPSLLVTFVPSLPSSYFTLYPRYVVFLLCLAVPNHPPRLSRFPLTCFTLLSRYVQFCAFAVPVSLCQQYVCFALVSCLSRLSSLAPQYLTAVVI